MLNIAFRTDASSQIGTGHVMRCLTLADAMREQGANCQFICLEHEGHLIDYIQSRGYKVHALTKSQIKTTIESDLAHAHLLGIDWQTDASQTRQALGNEALDWLIVDHYALDHCWESNLRSSCQNIMVIDDLADRQHDCDLLLDQNYGSSTGRYQGLVPASCVQCYGPEYALLNPVYTERRSQMLAREGYVQRVLIYFGGGADSANFTGMAVQAINSHGLADIKLDIVVGKAYAHLKLLEEQVEQRGNATIYQNLPYLADLIAKADLAIGACGATTWERCCLGLPSVLVVCALNQVAIGEAIGKLGAGIVLYPSENITSEIREQILTLFNDSKKYLQMSHRAEQICDGLGVSRVSKKII